MVPLALAVCASAGGGQTGSVRQDTAQTPAPPPAPKHFQPGVQIDWQTPAVIVQTRVVLDQGPLEFLACFAGKEHESILRIEAAAAHVYAALGLIGISPGHPPRWQPEPSRLLPPEGDLVDITLQWQHEDQTRTATAHDWLLEVAYARPVPPRPWVFSGSLRLEDGTLAADASGAGVAVVDFPDSLLCLSRGHTSSNESLWVVANSNAVPPVGTPVRLVLRPAQHRKLDVRLDHRAAAWLNGACVGPDDLSDILALNHRLAPSRVQPIVVSPALLSADSDALRATLQRHGIPSDAIRLEPRPAASSAPAPQDSTRARADAPTR